MSNKEKQNVFDFLRQTWGLTRTIVSKDNYKFVSLVKKYFYKNLKIQKFKTDVECETWKVPNEWKLISAVLKDKNKKVIASSTESKLFIPPYSKSFQGYITKKELLNNLITDKKNIRSFCYNWRFAYDHNLRSKKWGITLPYERVKKLHHTNYYLSIRTREKKGEMIICSASTKQKKAGTFYFLSHYCHPEQANDSISGVVLFSCIMKNLLTMNNLKYCYIHLLCPETIGSVFYLSKLNKPKQSKIIGSIFSDSIGYGKNWCFKHTRSKSTILDKIILQLKIQNQEIKIKNFGDPYGNDELIFNSIQSDIPSISMYKFPFSEYHTNADKPEKIKYKNLLKAKKFIQEIIFILENNKIYKFVHKTPFWMSRYNLFSDDQMEPRKFKIKFRIVYELINGENSILDIANELNISFRVVNKFLSEMKSHGLIYEII